MATPNLQLPEVPEAIQEAADEINAGNLRLDGIVQLAVLDKDLTAPPASPVQGDRYIVPIGATGAWAGRGRSIAFRGPGAVWLFLVPRPGWQAIVIDESMARYIYDGTAWVIEPSGGGGGGESTATRGAAWVRSTAIDTPVNDVDVYVPYDCVITGVRIATKGGPGSCVIDIWRDSTANYPPTVADSIVAAAKPTISSGVLYADDTLTGWSVACSAGDWLTFRLESSSSFFFIAITLIMEPAP